MKKKYPSLKDEMIELNKKLLVNPRLGIPLGMDCYKIRMAIKSKGKGKSSGAIIITNLVVTVKFTNVYLLTIYDKSEIDSVSDIELKRLIQGIKK